METYYVNSSDGFGVVTIDNSFSYLDLSLFSALFTDNVITSVTRQNTVFEKKLLKAINSLQATVTFLAYHFGRSTHRFSKSAIIMNFPHEIS